MSNETAFKKRIRPQLDALPNSWWEKIQQVSIRGTPDFIGSVNGHFVALELKRNNRAKIDAMQIHKLKKIADTGGVALVTWPENWDATYKLLKQLADGDVVDESGIARIH